jgi:predicted RNA binding protein YcfA (HicA-like mRNA interferase family)
MKVTWQELRAICLMLGCVESRTKGDHLAMARPGMARPVIIKMDNDLGEDIVRSNMHTLGVSRKEFEQLLARVRRYPRRKHRKH